jgi:hypothetical protein
MVQRLKGKYMRAFDAGGSLSFLRLRNRRPRRAVAIVAVLGLQGALLSSVMAAQSNQAAAPAASSPFQVQANQLGARKCVNLFAGLGRMVTQGSSYGVQVEVNKAAPDANALQGVVGMTLNLPGLKGRAAGVVLAAPTVQGCQGNMVRVAPLAKPCSEVVKMLPAGSVAAGELSGVPLYNVPSSQDRVLLIANGAGSCVAVSVNQAWTS